MHLTQHVNMRAALSTTLTWSTASYSMQKAIVSSMGSSVYSIHSLWSVPKPADSTTPLTKQINIIAQDSSANWFMLFRVVLYSTYLYFLFLKSNFLSVVKIMKFFHMVKMILFLWKYKIIFSVLPVTSVTQMELCILAILQVHHKYLILPIVSAFFVKKGNESTSK